MKEEIEKYMFRPVLITDNLGNESLITIFNTQYQTDKFRGDNGDIDEHSVVILNLIDIQKSYDDEDLCFHSAEYNKDEITSIKFAEREHDDKVTFVSYLANQELESKYSEINVLGQLVTSLNFDIEKRLDKNNPIPFEFSCKSLFDNVPLNEEDFEQIMPHISNVLEKHKYADLEDQKQMEDIERAIEQSVIFALPNTVELEDVKINKEKVKTIINNLREIE